MKVAVVLFNLGGPDGPEAVRPFLFNLFNDAAIISLAQPLRWLLAAVISHRRTPVAKEIYAHLGGKSPLLEQTESQARALESDFQRTNKNHTFKCFIAMRYWHPMAAAAARAVADFAPDRIVLLPLYPQFSTTTTGSSLAEWKRAAGAIGLAVPTAAVCCYPGDAGLASAQAELIAAAQKQTAGARILFSAHGLPKKIVDRGDSYPLHVATTAAAIIAQLGGAPDWAICYQSRVGPLEWIGPSVEDELARAAADGVPVIVVPIAFVSEHSETLVELDIEYRTLAKRLGVPGYVRVATVGTHANFIAGLARLTEQALTAVKDGDLRGGIELTSGRGGCAPCLQKMDF